MALKSPASSSPDDCCYRTALDRGAVFCDECGKPIVRCMANEECGELLDEEGRCPMCVAPEVSLDAGAATSVKVGGTLALPLLVTNTSPVGRPLFIEAMWMRGADGQMKEVDLPFQRLNSGATADVGLRTGRLDTPGIHRIDVMFVAATRFLWREERYVFTAGIAIPVEAEGPSEVVQNYTIQADQIGAGLTIYNPTRIQKEREAGVATHAEPIRLTLRRGDTIERQMGVRGYSSGMSLRRQVPISWLGFDKGQTPPDGPISTPSGTLGFGRASNAAGGGMNDVRLVISGQGGVDEGASVHISRRHFLLFVENDRLMLRVESQNGATLNDAPLKRGQTHVIESGDVIAPLVREPGAVSLKIEFETQHDEVGRITVRRRVGATGR